MVRDHPRFRRIWLAQVASQTGDWFNKVAVLSILSRLAGSEAAVGLGLSFAVEHVARLLPLALVSPLAGPLADRLPRRALMVGTDLARMAVVAAMLTVDQPSEVPRLYLLVALQMGLGICFDAARQAALPSTLAPTALHDGIALTSATWSAMLSVGALLGGLVVTAFGARTALVVDVGTYAVSAAILGGLGRLPQAKVPEPFRWVELLTLRDMRRALDHVREVGIAPALFTKAFWGPTGGMLVLFSVLAATRFGLDGDGRVDPARMGGALGILYAARGVGTAVGPFLGRRLFGHTGVALLHQIRAGFVVATVGFALLAWAPTLPLAAACVVLAHLGGGAIWVASTAFWQESVDDRFRGRVHALDFLGMTLSFSACGLLAGALVDGAPGTLGALAITVVLLALSGAAWNFATRAIRRRAAGAPPEPARGP